MKAASEGFERQRPDNDQIQPHFHQCQLKYYIRPHSVGIIHYRIRIDHQPTLKEALCLHR